MAKPKPLRIKFVGKNTPAPKQINGAHKIILPSDQSKPFTHVDADLILKLLPELYKPVIVKHSRFRSAKNGKFIKQAEAIANPDTTVKETL